MHKCTSVQGHLWLIYGLAPGRPKTGFLIQSLTKPTVEYGESGVSISWRRHQLETFSALLALCVGNSPVTGEFPARRPVTRSFDVSFDMCLNKWVNNLDAGDLRRHSVHYDVITMTFLLSCRCVAEASNRRCAKRWIHVSIKDISLYSMG